MKKTAEEILIKNGCAFVEGTTPDHFIAAMEEYRNQDNESLKDRLFKIANELAVAGFGWQAVIVHTVNNNLADLPSPPKTK